MGRKGITRRAKIMRRAARRRDARAAQSAGTLQTKPQSGSALRGGLDLLGYAATIGPFLPYALVATVTGGLAWFLGWSAPLIILLLLGGAWLAFVLTQTIPDKRLSYTIIAVTLLSGLGVGAWQYDRYEITLADVQIGLVPAEINGYAAGARISVLFENPNDFDIWVMSDRRVTTVGKLVSNSEQDSHTIKRDRDSHFGISDGPILFDSPLAPGEVAGGRIDYHLCYGRTRKSMNKGLTIKANYNPRFLGDGTIDTTYEPTEVKEGGCG